MRPIILSESLKSENSPDSKEESFALSLIMTPGISPGISPDKLQSGFDVHLEYPFNKLISYTPLTNYQSLYNIEKKYMEKKNAIKGMIFPAKAFSLYMDDGGLLITGGIESESIVSIMNITGDTAEVA